MGKVNFTFNITLDENEFIRVEDHLYTTRETLSREEPKVHMINQHFLTILKTFEGRITMKAIEEWMLLSRALDQTCSFEHVWDDHKILEELVKGHDHPVSWYAKNCKVTQTTPVS